MKKQRNNYKIGLYLDQVMQRKNISIAKLSELSEIDKFMLQKYIINKRSPSLYSIQLIANAMDLPVEYFTVETFDEPYSLVSLNDDGYELCAHIANTDMIMKIVSGDEKSCSNAFKVIQKLNNQIFNTLTPEGKEKMVLAMYESLMDDLYPIAFEEKNNENYWWYIFDDKSMVERNLSVDRRTVISLKNHLNDIVDKVVRKENNDEELGKLENILSKAVKNVEDMRKKKDEG